MSKLDLNQVRADFKRSTENHTMEVLLDMDTPNGPYRHLKFTNNGSQCYRFDIHIWPGFLCICQDMGTYVFSRVNDMFTFFGSDVDAEYAINPHYWGEKIQATDGNRSTEGGFEEFSIDIFKENVKNEFNMFKEDTELNEGQIAELWNELQEEVFDVADDGGDTRAYDAAMGFTWEAESDLGIKEKFDMHEFWDYSCTDYKYHYIWILYAIVWGNGQYQKTKEVDKVA